MRLSKWEVLCIGFGVAGPHPPETSQQEGQKIQGGQVIKEKIVEL